MLLDTRLGYRISGGKPMLPTIVIVAVVVLMVVLMASGRGG